MIDQCGPKPLGQHSLDSHRRPDRAEQQVAGVANQPVQIERRRREVLLTREREKLVRQSCASFGSGARRAQSAQRSFAF